MMEDLFDSLARVFIHLQLLLWKLSINLVS